LKTVGYQPQLFDSVRDRSTPVKFELPNLIGERKLFCDTEGTGLRVTSGTDKAVGLSVVTPDLTSWYIPWGHAQGFNFQLDHVQAWIADNFVGKETVWLNAKHDIHSLYNSDIDLESVGGVTVRDVAYHAALTNSKRQSYALADLAIEHSTKRKIELKGNLPIHLRYSEDVWEYACRDAALLVDIETSLNKRIVSEKMEKVRDLEDSLIYAVCSMERSGAIIDRSKLEQWQQMCSQRMTRIFWKLASEAGFKVEPNKSSSVSKLCQKLGVSLPVLDTGSESLTNEWLLKQTHPLLRLVFEWRKLSDLRSDYLDKYLVCLDGNNKIRYNLNQLKSDKFGTVTGRFSSSGSKNPDDDKKINVQQVVKTEDNDEDDEIISDMPIRELFIPEQGREWLSADASQLQFRIFAHYSNDQRLIARYSEDVFADFHHLVNRDILGGKLCRIRTNCGNCTAKRPAEGCGRDKAKHENFGNLFGMGVEKGARRLGVTVEEYREIKRIYNDSFPAAKGLSYQAQGLARHPSLGPHPYTNKVGRGYVRTVSGRRRRYDPNDNLNSAVNAVIQGTEADIVKVKLLELYNKRKDFDINLYFTVHDEFDGGVPKDTSSKVAREITEMLNDHESFETAFDIRFKVPIVWEVGVGENWKHLKKVKLTDV
jgi:DNA polymerase-1